MEFPPRLSSALWLATTAAGRDVLAHALASELKLDVLVTRYRGHAAEATAQAVRDGVELLVAHGGDGTVNEVVNGMLQGTGCLLYTSPSPRDLSTSRMPSSA